MQPFGTGLRFWLTFCLIGSFSGIQTGQYVMGQRGRVLLNVAGHKFVKNRISSEKIYWICCKKGTTSCRARVITKNNQENDIIPNVIGASGNHNHAMIVPRKPRIKSFIKPIKDDNYNWYFKDIWLLIVPPLTPALSPKFQPHFTEINSLKIFLDKDTETVYYIAEFLKGDSSNAKILELLKTGSPQDEFRKQSFKNKPRLPVLKKEVKEINYNQSGRGNNVLIFEGNRYIKNNFHSGKTYWKCTKWHSNCKARAITDDKNPGICLTKNTHNHE